MEQSSASGIPKNPDKFINVVLNHGEHSAVFRVNTKIIVEELKHLACKQWRSLSPGSICFSYMDNAQVVFVKGDIQLQSLIGFMILIDNEDVYLRVGMIPNHTSRSKSGCIRSSGSKSGCISSSGSCSKSACETESPKMVRVLDHDADKGKPLIIDEWNYVFYKIGREFMGGVKAVRIALDKYKMATGHKIVILKNDTTRFTAKCEEDGCAWRIHFGPVNGDTSRFVLKDSNAHRCTLGCTVLVVLLKYMFLLALCGDPSLKPRQIISLFKKTYGSNIKYHHARRGKEAVFEEQYGDDEKSYSDFTWYVKAIEETNPDSYVRFEVEDGTNRFQRIFVCYGACKHSYRYLRPMIYLDATFLTGRYRGTLMAATCINGNNEFYPFAFAIVSSENKDNWFWFLENLQKLVDGRDANSKPVLDLFYKDAYSYTPANFEKALRGMHAIGCGNVANYIRIIPKEKWANAFFPVCRYGAHSSTLAESFNNWVLPFKKLPAFVLLDAIRLKVMEKTSERRILGLETFNTRLTPEYEGLIKENIDIGRTWTIVQSMERLYEFRSPRTHSVDLLQKTCTCHRSRVNGFPCAHACASIQATREDIYSFVEPYFTTEWYNRTYQHIILPIPNYDKPKSYDPSDRVIVPIHVPPRGRRRTHRIKNAYEKQKRAMMCTKCFTLGHHNRTTCPMI
ncbi:uncharacterized protein LOC113315620 [Papaver somniferum]|uniref:uncharacterized protein LOC113315620 n=1 Tax=Papaver somniferum TaxID=3469 RepID=UPI000E6FD582|nr:uncharacterized protein LOC113315620 [Papaver somniferum]